MTFKRRLSKRTLSKRNYDDPAYAKWRYAVYARDNHQCQWPECKKKKHLNAHHIKKWADFPSLRLEIHNGITLCRAHHDKIKGREVDFERFFYTILSQKLLKTIKKLTNGQDTPTE